MLRGYENCCASLNTRVQTPTSKLKLYAGCIHISKPRNERSGDSSITGASIAENMSSRFIGQSVSKLTWWRAMGEDSSIPCRTSYTHGGRLAHTCVHAAQIHTCINSYTSTHEKIK